MRKTFKVEFLPDFRQRKDFKKVLDAVGSVRSHVVNDLVRQYNTISLFQSEREVAESVLEDAMASGLLECSVRHAVTEAYARFLLLVSGAKGGEIMRRPRVTVGSSVEIPKDEVLFSAFERVVMVPYVGLVKYRPNLFMSPKVFGETSENTHQLLGNVTRICAGLAGQVYFVLIDRREEGSDAASQPKIRKRARKLPELLK